MADLHIHSALSPCGSLEMSPRLIVERAKELGLNLIAITDHNAVENGYYAGKIAKEYGINVFYGMEAQTEEEIHILVLFDTYEQAYEMWKEFYAKLPGLENVPDYFGDQVVVDENEEIVRFEKKLLLNSALVNVDELFAMVKRYDGICIPSHVNQESYSIVAQLGFIPENLDIDGVEITYNAREEDVIKKFPFLEKYTLVSFSDAHYPGDIGRACTEFYMDSPTINELKKALKGEDGRKVKIIRKGGAP